MTPEFQERADALKKHLKPKKGNNQHTSPLVAPCLYPECTRWATNHFFCGTHIVLGAEMYARMMNEERYSAQKEG